MKTETLSRWETVRVRAARREMRPHLNPLPEGEEAKQPMIDSASLVSLLADADYFDGSKLLPDHRLIL